MIKLLELFGGIGACSAALKRIGIEYEIADYVEIDKYAVKSYNAIHNTNFEPQDISKWDKDIAVDLIMHGSPCQDFSLAGKQAGGDKGSGTRSSLMYETVRIVEKLKPKYVVWENVKNLLSKNHRHNFEHYLEVMEQLGYTNYYKVLNAKNYGIPQNRERVFTISILNGVKFEFPEPFPLELRLKDMLDHEVDEKYYLSDTCIRGFVKHRERHKAKGTGFIWKPRDLDGVASCLRANASLAPTDNTIIVEPRCIQVAQMYGTEREPNPQAGRVYDADGISPTIDTCSGGNKMPKIIEPVNTMPDGTCRTIKNQYYKTSKANFDRTSTFGATGVSDDSRSRKLTPKECWRLMGFDDEDFDKAQAVNSNTQLYKQAGNSIVVDVLAHIFTNLFKEENEVKKVEEKKVVTYETDKMIDLLLLKEKEPKLFEELVADYPCEDATYIFEVKAN